MSKTKILVAEIPDWDDLKDALRDFLGIDNEPKDETPDWEDNVPRPSTPKTGAPLPPWGIGGAPEDRNLHFGADFEIDEPRAEDYDKRWQFESDHAAYDRFVDAGEDCIARGMAKPAGVVKHKCNAIRRTLEEGPVIGRDLIGETHWW